MTATLSTLRPGAHFQVTAPSWDREKPRPVYELLALSACAARTTLGWIALSTDVEEVTDYQVPAPTEEEPEIPAGKDPDPGTLAAQVLNYARGHAAERPANGWLTAVQLEAAVIGARRVLKQLVKAGLLTKLGRARGTRYRARSNQ